MNNGTIIGGTVRSDDALWLGVYNGTNTIDGVNIAGHLYLSAGTTTFKNAWSNTGLITGLKPNVFFSTDFSLTQLGDAFFDAGTVTLNAALSNGSTTLDLDQLGGYWQLASPGRIDGGTIRSTTGRGIHSGSTASGTLSGVTLASYADVVAGRNLWVSGV